MTDRELLELAAKAAGYVPREGQLHWPNKFILLKDGKTDDKWICWNPLADDGDALRLATKLRLTIRHQASWSNSDACMDVGILAFDCRENRDLPRTYVTYVRGDLSEKTREIERDFIAYMLRTGQWVDSAETATRRAIVRAAAEIGKSMP